jgi:hypothetical protein
MAAFFRIQVTRAVFYFTEVRPARSPKPDVYRNTYRGKTLLTDAQE